jgi:hypothetical protein
MPLAVLKNLDVFDAGRRHAGMLPEKQPQRLLNPDAVV